MKKEDFIELAGKISDGTASEQEITLYNTYFNHFQQDKEWETSVMEDSGQIGAELKARIDWHILSPQKNRTGTLILKWMTAAAVLLLISASGYLYFNDNVSTHTIAAQKPKYEIKPGGNKAILILGDGSKIALNNTRNGVLTRQNGSTVRKLNDGRLVYQTPEKANSSALQGQPVVFNNIITPRGGQYQIDLPDGTRVWLNAASSLRYPVAFNGRERVVTLSGEAYFEVARQTINDAGKIPVPFKVIVNNKQEVQVLGTHFNIMAYPDEGLSKTTLLKGSVKIIKDKQERLLVPGQQALVETDIKVSYADVDEAIAWKNGQISFKDENLKAIMQRISRWYDVDINYDGHIPRRLFTGGIAKDSNLPTLLRVLELNNIHCSVYQRTITVTP